MIAQATQILAQSRDTLMYDLGGVVALAALTMGMLYLPGLI
ncbi:hypothetical protein [Gymnodinialimonas phycosphaerae]|nr:hypothetical protein [Gymnodinialimonas phycosphaerae]